MIKLNHLPNKVMDLVMDTARANNVTVDMSIIILLESILKNEAERANTYGETPTENTGSSS